MSLQKNQWNTKEDSKRGERGEKLKIENWTKW